MLASALLSLSLGCNHPSYKLMAGDELDFRIWRGEGSLLLVQPDGEVSTHLAGAVPVAGLTLPEALRVFTEKLQTVMVNPRVMLRVHRCGVSILGAVRRPGRVEWDSTLTVARAVTAAGGARSRKSTVLLSEVGQETRLRLRSSRDAKRLIQPGAVLKIE